MEDIRDQLIGIRDQIKQFETVIQDVTPKRGQLKWFGQKRFQVQLQLLFKGSEDVLNHAATLRGYFDGITARGDFQRYVAEHLGSPPYGKMNQLMKYLTTVLKEVDLVLADLCQRTPLVMAAKGPKKPGPKRTLEVCKAHLSSLQNTLCIVVMGLASNQELIQRARFHLIEES